jgi:hypothetical protein
MDPRELLRTIQLGSISSSRCQKSRMLLHPEWSMRSCISSRTVVCWRRPAFAREGFGAAAFATNWLAEP